MILLLVLSFENVSSGDFDDGLSFGLILEAVAMEF